MQGFDSVIGHEEIITHLQNAISLNKVSHSYIFDGEAGCGKKLLATLFAMTLQCEEKGIDPCLKCSSCKKALSKNHPDIINITHEKPNSIGIDEIRAQLVNDIDIRPYSSPYKIYIVNEAQKLTPQAQNAILKTIEEPPAYAVIMLLTNNADSLLPTILSRCVRLQIRAVSDDLVKKYLMERLHLPDYQAELNASFAQGNIGKAKQISESDEFISMSNQIIRILKRSQKCELHDMVETIKAISSEKENINEYLDLIVMWYRDVLLFKATREVDNLVFKRNIDDIRVDARNRSYEGLEIIIDAVAKAKTRLESNVNFELTMELLFLTIREN